MPLRGKTGLGAGIPSREFGSLGLRPSLGMFERGLRPRKHQIAYRRFATFPRRDAGSQLSRPRSPDERLWPLEGPQCFKKAAGDDE